MGNLSIKLECKARKECSQKQKSMYEIAEMYALGSTKEEVQKELEEHFQAITVHEIMFKISSAWHQLDWGYAEFLRAVNDVLGEIVYQVPEATDIWFDGRDIPFSNMGMALWPFVMKLSSIKDKDLDEVNRISDKLRYLYLQLEEVEESIGDVVISLESLDHNLTEEEFNYYLESATKKLSKF